MKIALVTDTYWPRVNGVAMSVDSFRHELIRQGHEVLVLCPRYGSEPPEPGVARFAAIQAPLTPEDRLVRPWARKAVFATLDGFAPDVLHIQTELPLGNLARRWGRRRGVPVVITSHTYFEKYARHYVPWLPARWTEAVTRWVSSRSLSAADLVLVPSQLMKNVLVGYGIDKPIEVLPTGFNPRDFEGVDHETEKASSFLFARHPHLKGRTILLYVGRVGEEKNLSLLVEVARRLRTSVTNFSLVIVGDGPARAAIEATARDEGMDQTIVTTGYVDRHEIRRVYALADVFVFASKTETQGLVTMEAMLCGVPVVAVGEMGTREVMEGDRGGFLVNTVEEFTERVRTLIDDPELRRAKATEARAHAENWLIEPLTRRLVTAYESVLRLGATPSRR